MLTTRVSTNQTTATPNTNFARFRCRHTAHARLRTYLTRVKAIDRESMPESLSALVQSFQAVPDPMQRYRQLLFMAKALKPLSTEALDDRYKVPGCVSQVWIVPSFRGGLVYYEAESDSQLTKGLAALLIKGLSGNSPQDIAEVKPEFLGELGLKTALTPSRTNGLLNMLNLMQMQARSFI